MGFSDDPWLSVGLVITATVNVVGRDSGDVAESRQLPVPAFDAPRANLGGVSGLLAIHGLDPGKKCN